MSRLRDSFGRVIDDLRISVTDRCNFRCTYCMPAEGMKWVVKAEILSYEEIVRVARIMVELGIITIRVTGGEPTVRANLEVLIRGLSQIDPTLDLTMTTNGFLLKKQARALREAGLKRINVSLDSLRRECFAQMTRRDALHEVLEGLEEASAVGFSPIKINAVVVRGVNENEVVDFARLAREKGYQVRFIEFMPLDADRAWSMEKVVPAREILARIDADYPLVPATTSRPEPATVFRFADGRGEVGVIPSVTEPFCDSCNRIRITADGQLRTCLFSTTEHNLKGLLRTGAPDEEIADFIIAAVWTKEPGHRINRPDFIQPVRSMSAIGG